MGAEGGKGGSEGAGCLQASGRPSYPEARTVMSWYSDLPYSRLYSVLMSRRSISLRDTMMRIRVRSFVPAP